jgi:hypothetical protein
VARKCPSLIAICRAIAYCECKDRPMEKSQ